MGELVIQVSRFLTELVALREVWNDAVTLSDSPNIFLTFEWLATWWEHFGAGRRDYRLHVITIADPDGIVAIAPFFWASVGVGPLRTAVLRQISHDAGDYGGIVLVRRHKEAVDLLTNHLSAELGGGYAAAVLSRLPTDGQLAQLLQDRVAGVPHLSADEEALGAGCPYTEVPRGVDMRRQAKKHRVRSRLRRLHEQYGDVVFEYHTGETLETGLERFLAVHRRRWEGREQEMQGQLADAAHEAFLLDAVRALDREGRVRLLTLTADGQPVAAELDFVICQRQLLFKGAFDPEFSAFGPGHLLIHRAFEDGIAAGITEFDFGRGDHPYKGPWTNGERHLVTMTLTRSGVRGQLDGQRLRLSGAIEKRLATHRR